MKEILVALNTYGFTVYKINDIPKDGYVVLLNVLTKKDKIHNIANSNKANVHFLKIHTHTQ